MVGNQSFFLDGEADVYNSDSGLQLVAEGTSEGLALRHWPAIQSKAV